MKSCTFDITGMTCASCQAHISDRVSKLDGVKRAEVNLLAESMSVEFDESTVTAADIANAVKAVGYGAKARGESGKDDSSPRSVRAARLERAKTEENAMLRRLIASAVILLPLMYISMGHMLGLPMPAILHGEGNALINALAQLTLTLPIVFTNRGFFTSGFRALLSRSPNMDTLIALGSSAALIYGIAVVYIMAYKLGRGEISAAAEYAHNLYFESCAMILTLVTVGKYLETRSKAKTSDALGRLIELSPPTASVIRGGEESSIPSEEIIAGDIVVLRPGDSVPCDGVVTLGDGWVDEAPITGESIPVEKHNGDTVISATLLKNGSLRFEATRVGTDTTIAKIIRLVEEAGASKAPIARLADKVAGIFVPAVTGIALLTAVIWLLAGQGIEVALSNSIAVLVISCPCALGLATPVAIMAGTGRAAEMGILVKSAEALETLDKVDTVALDKTGTVTEGRPTVTDIISLDASLGEGEMLAFCASLEAGSEHPLGEAVVNRAEADGIGPFAAEGFEAVAGMGVKAEINGQSWLSGNAVMLERESVRVSDEANKACARLSDEGKTPMLFARDGKIAGIIAAADTIRSDSREAAESLRREKIRVVMLTGDNPRTAEAVRASIGIDEVYSGVLPDGKEERVAALMKAGRIVAMVGDGINDAPALTRANVGIAIGAGTDIAIDAADVVLMRDSLSDAVKAIKLSRAVMLNIKENLFWAFFYNVLGIPIAAGALYPAFGIELSPMIAAAAMSLSSVTVVLNALRLRGYGKKRKSKAEENNKNEEKTMKKLIKIEGMMCEHCVAHVKKALEAIDGVESAEVVLKKKSAAVTLSSEVEDKTLAAAIKDAGYEVKEIKES